MMATGARGGPEQGGPRQGGPPWGGPQQGGPQRGGQWRPAAHSQTVGRLRPSSSWAAWMGLVGVVVASGCTGAAANHETLGDRAYAERRFGDALVEYRLALVRRAPNADLRAKAGAAALEVGDLRAAAEEYVALAREGGQDRQSEAADGLVRVANAALDERDQEALAVALDGLRAVDPARAVGTFAHQLVRVTGAVPRSVEGLTLLRYAAAGAQDARTQDSLMFGYGELLRRMERCTDALGVYESLGRRQREPAVVRQTREGLALCALQLGRRALDAGQPAQAEEWFRRAVQGGGETAPARAAYIGLGDVQFAQGDYFAAAEAYERARAGLAPGDSLFGLATERLNMLGRIR